MTMASMTTDFPLVIGCLGSVALLLLCGAVADWLLSERHPHNQRHRE